MSFVSFSLKLAMTSYNVKAFTVINLYCHNLITLDLDIRIIGQKSELNCNYRKKLSAAARFPVKDIRLKFSMVSSYFKLMT